MEIQWKQVGSYLTSGMTVLATRASCAAADSAENRVGHLMHVVAIKLNAYSL